VTYIRVTPGGAFHLYSPAAPNVTASYECADDERKAKSADNKKTTFFLSGITSPEMILNRKYFCWNIKIDVNIIH
jgi:hypothetical protein